MRRNIFYRKIPAALAAFVLALALCCQTAAAGRALVPGGYTVGIKLYAEGLMVTEVAVSYTHLTLPTTPYV